MTQCRIARRAPRLSAVATDSPSPLDQAERRTRQALAAASLDRAAGVTVLKKPQDKTIEVYVLASLMQQVGPQVGRALDSLGLGRTIIFDRYTGGELSVRQDAAGVLYRIVRDLPTRAY